MAESRTFSELITLDQLSPPSDFKFLSKLLSMIGWAPASSPAKLAQSEERILKGIPEVHENVQRHYVCIKKDQYIWTLSIANTSVKSPDATPLVFLHGVGTGAALWILNMASAAEHRTIYAIDMLGFGCSSRFTYSSDPVIAEMELVESLEAWREAVGLDTFILVGHCFGGYVATSYSIRYPTRVRHLILVDPWGFLERKSVTVEEGKQLPLPLWVRSLALLIQPFNPFSALRLAGSWGPALVARFKPDLIKNFDHLFADDSVAQYIYHWHAQPPSGEVAFKHMSFEFGWARFPMISRIKDLAAFTSMTVICGARSYLDSGLCQKIQELRRGSYFESHVIGGAGHFVFADDADLFNKLLRHTCSLIDHRLDVLLPAVQSRSRLRRVRSECGAKMVRPPSPPLRRRRCDSHTIAEELEASAADSAGISVAQTSDMLSLQQSVLQPQEPQAGQTFATFAISDDEF